MDSQEGKTEDLACEAAPPPPLSEEAAPPPPPGENPPGAVDANAPTAEETDDQDTRQAEAPGAPPPTTPARPESSRTSLALVEGGNGMSSPGGMSTLDGKLLIQDWALESGHILATSSRAMLLSDVQRQQSRKEMVSAIRVTMQSEAKTMRALRAKTHQTKNLKAILENTLDKTEYEITQMRECKERLQAEQERVNVNLGVNMDRRQHRAQRPERELVDDIAAKQLEAQTALLQDIVAKIDSCAEEVEDSLDHLTKIKWMLAEDLADKNASLVLDNKCIDLGLTWPEGELPDPTPPPVKLNHVPASWKVSTMRTVELSLQQHEEANSVRVRAAKIAHNGKLAEKVQYDMVQMALEKRCLALQRMKREMERKLQNVNAEVDEATKTKHRLEESIALKTPPLKITYQRIVARSQKPDRELVHDEVELALKEQYEALFTSVEAMNHQLLQVNKHLDTLLRTKAEMDADISDKAHTIDMERQCFSMAPPRPKTRGMLLGWHPISENNLGRESSVTWDQAASSKLMSY